MIQEIPNSNMKFEEHKLIGKGAFSRVYQIIDTTNNKIYALKKIDLKKITVGD